MEFFTATIAILIDGLTYSSWIFLVAVGLSLIFGVLGILNFAPVRLDVRDAVGITSVDFSVALEQLAFQVSLGLTGSLDEQEG